MLGIKKLTIGVQSQSHMFRVGSMSGQIADAIVAGIVDKPIRNAEYFGEVGLSQGPPPLLQLRSKDKNNSLSVTLNDVVFAQARYSSHVNVDRFLEEFGQLWSIVNTHLKVQQVRRLGLVAEHRVYEVDAPSKFLGEKLTKYPQSDFVGKFQCIFEKHLPVVPGTAPDIKTGEFTNVIHQFYDSALDIETPEEHAINLNLDVQHYFTSKLGTNMIAEAKELRRQFESHWRDFQTQITSLGLIV
jgi:hypothetical protein